jgi:hypothetical protein
MKRSLRVRLEARKFVPCDIDTCTRRVAGLSRHCAFHNLRSLRYGAPEQGPVPKSATAPYARTVARVLKANAEHPRIVMATGELFALLTAAVPIARANPKARVGRPVAHDVKCRQARELHRLYRAGITGFDMLREIAAVYFYAQAHPRELAPSSVAYQFAIARSVLKLAQKEAERFSTRVLASLGRALDEMLSDVLPAMADAVERHANRDRERHAKRIAALSQPIT